MILDNGCPKSVAGAKCMDKYMRENGLTAKDLNKSNVNVVFKFGETRIMEKQRVELPVRMKTVDE